MTYTSSRAAACATCITHVTHVTQEWLKTEQDRQAALFKARNAAPERIETEDFSYELEEGMGAKIKRFRQVQHPRSKRCTMVAAAPRE